MNICIVCGEEGCRKYHKNHDGIPVTEDISFHALSNNSRCCVCGTNTERLAFIDNYDKENEKQVTRLYCKSCVGQNPKLPEIPGSRWNKMQEFHSNEKEDIVNKPKHYNSHPSGIECITIAQHHSFNIGNVFKYLWRAGVKNESTKLEDLKKAQAYLGFEITKLEREENNAKGNQ